MSALQSACRQGDLPLVLSLLSQHPEALCSRDELGWTALYRAVIAQQEATVSLLLSKGADPNMQYSLGETALHYASEYGYLPIVRALIESKADPNRQQKGGK